MIYKIFSFFKTGDGGHDVPARDVVSRGGAALQHVGRDARRDRLHRHPLPRRLSEAHTRARARAQTNTHARKNTRTPTRTQRPLAS